MLCHLAAAALALMQIAGMSVHTLVMLWHHHVQKYAEILLEMGGDANHPAEKRLRRYVYESGPSPLHVALASFGLLLQAIR